MTETPAGPRPCARCVVPGGFDPWNRRCRLWQGMGIWTPREEAPPAKRGHRRDRR